MTIPARPKAQPWFAIAAEVEPGAARNKTQRLAATRGPLRLVAAKMKISACVSAQPRSVAGARRASAAHYSWRRGTSVAGWP